MIDFLATLLAKAFYGDEGAQGCLTLIVIGFIILGVIGSIFN